MLMRAAPGLAGAAPTAGERAVPCTAATVDVRPSGSGASARGGPVGGSHQHDGRGLAAAAARDRGDRARPLHRVCPRCPFGCSKGRPGGRPLACDLRVAGDLHLPSRPQGSMEECPVREPCPPKCCYPDVRRSDPTCEAPGTTASIWEHQPGGGPAEDGRLNESERPLSRSVIGNRPKVLTGRRQNGTRVGSPGAITGDGGNMARRTIGRSLPIRISTLDNRVSPTRPAARRCPDRKEGRSGGGRGTAEQAKAAL